MTNTRTETAKRHDDGDLVDQAENAPDQRGRAGGDKSKAVGTRDEHKRVDDPDTTTGVDKADDRADVKPNETGGNA